MFRQPWLCCRCSRKRPGVLTSSSACACVPPGLFRVVFNATSRPLCQFPLFGQRPARIWMWRHISYSWFWPLVFGGSGSGAHMAWVAAAGWHSGRFNGVYVCHEVWEKEMHQTWDCGNEVWASFALLVVRSPAYLAQGQLASLASTQLNLSGFLIYRFPRRSTQRHGSWTISWLFLRSPRPFAGRTDCSVGRSEHRHRHWQNWQKQRQRRVGLIGKCYMVG